MANIGADVRRLHESLVSDYGRAAGGLRGGHIFVYPSGVQVFGGRGHPYCRFRRLSENKEPDRNFGVPVMIRKHQGAQHREAMIFATSCC